MGHKVHPIGFRIGVIRDWTAKWYADKHYLESVHEDLKLRQAIQSGYPEAGIAQVEISRQTPDNHPLLKVLLPEYGDIGLDDIEELQDDGRDAVEMTGTF